MTQPEAFKENIRSFVLIRDPPRTLLPSRLGPRGLSTVVARSDGVDVIRGVALRNRTLPSVDMSQILSWDSRSAIVPHLRDEHFALFLYEPSRGLLHPVITVYLPSFHVINWSSTARGSRLEL